jgi:hypothetical protein
MPYPANVKDPNELLVSRKDAAVVFTRCLNEAEPRPAPLLDLMPATSPTSASSPTPPATVPASAPVVVEPPRAPAPAPTAREDDGDGRAAVTIERGGITYHARVCSALLGKLRVTLRASRGTGFHLDTIDLYSARSRSEFARRAAKVLGAEVDAIEADVLAVVGPAEKLADNGDADKPVEVSAPEMSESDRAEALALLKRPDLLDQVARDVDALGYVGEETNKRLLYLVAVSRKLPDPLSAIVLSQSGAGKSGITEVIEKLTPSEDVVLLTRLTPQSLYYVEPGFLDKKLVIVEERYGSMEADYSIRVLQSRKKLIAAAPIKDPQTGNMKTRIFTVEARAAFIEATTASAVNHENATRCFELTMDETAEQTRRIHERQRLMRTEAGLELRQQADQIGRRHWNAQRLLEPLPVVIPYADKLTFPVAWMRTRRDHARFLNLIEVSAFLHQYQRERRGGAIVAALADYEAAYALSGELLADTLSDLKAPLRNALTRIKGLADENSGTVSRRDIRERLKEPDSTVRRWLADLVELEYLAVIEGSKGGQGKATRYQLLGREDERAPLTGLLTPAELVDRLR